MKMHDKAIHLILNLSLTKVDYLQNKIIQITYNQQLLSKQVINLWQNSNMWSLLFCFLGRRLPGQPLVRWHGGLSIRRNKKSGRAELTTEPHRPVGTKSNPTRTADSCRHRCWPCTPPLLDNRARNRELKQYKIDQSIQQQSTCQLNERSNPCVSGLGLLPYSDFGRGVECSWVERRVLVRCRASQPTQSMAANSTRLWMDNG